MYVARLAGVDRCAHPFGQQEVASPGRSATDYRPPPLGRLLLTAHYWPPLVGHLLAAYYWPPCTPTAYYWPANY